LRPNADPPTIGALFAGFFSIGICGFGGVLPWARRMIVEQRRWLTAAEFTDLLALCQFLPGPNIINLSVALGSRFRGPRGHERCADEAWRPAVAGGEGSRARRELLGH